MKKTTQQKSLLEYYRFSRKEEKEYPVITKILKQLTPERIEKEIKDIQKIELPPELQKWVKEYKKVSERSEFVWKLVLIHSTIITFSTSKNDAELLRNTKFLIFMFILLIDDVADKAQDENLLKEISKIPFGKKYIKFNKLNQKEKKYLKFIIKIWDVINKKTKKYPKYEIFKEMFEHNILQSLNGLKYSYTINKKPYLINKMECLLYLHCSGCSIQLLSNFIIDCMHSPNITVKKFKELREAVYNAQEIVRRGNWISSWDEEIKENDFTSGTCAYAIDSNIITVDDLEKKDKSKVIKKIKNSDTEKKILKEWEDYYREINKKFKKTNLKKYFYTLKKLLILVLSAYHSKKQ